MTRVYKKAPEQIEKQCTACLVVKPAKDFHKDASSGRLRFRCRLCTAAYNRDQYAKHREARVAYDAARGPGWDRSGREKYAPPEAHKWLNYIKRVYGLTAEQYGSMLVSQQGVCAICRQECNRSTTTRMCVDHDHETGKVRGLLCFQCNVGLGKFKDSAHIVRAAAHYLERTAK